MSRVCVTYLEFLLGMRVSVPCPFLRQAAFLWTVLGPKIHQIEMSLNEDSLWALLRLATVVI